MGTYKNSIEEIKDKIWNVLDHLEGEVYQEDFQRACMQVADKYPNFSK